MRCQVLDKDNTIQLWTLDDRSVRLQGSDEYSQQSIILTANEAEQLTQALLQQGYALGGWTFARLAGVSGLVGAAVGYVLGGLGAG